MKLDADCRSKNERQGPGGAAECRSPCVRARMGSSFAASRRWRTDSVDMNLAPGDVMSSYAYIVIGAGSSGCIVASRERTRVVKGTGGAARLDGGGRRRIQK